MIVNVTINGSAKTVVICDHPKCRIHASVVPGTDVEARGAALTAARSEGWAERTWGDHTRVRHYCPDHAGRH